MAINRLESEHIVSLAICTFGRPGQVMNTLKKISHLMLNNGLNLPVLIIDNNKGKETWKELQSIFSNNNNFKYINEERVGLSHARNCAVVNCQTQYIAFIDDDAFPNVDYFKELIKMCQEGFDTAGGSQIPYSDLDLPTWYSINHDDQSVNNLASGFNMAFKVSSLTNVGLFEPKLGMNGKKIAYGEDILPQIRIKKFGGKFIYNKNLKVHHYIQPYKLTKKWQLKSSYAHGRDSWRLFDRKNLTVLDSLYLIKEFITEHLSFSKDFTKQKTMAFELGRLAGSFIYWN